MLKILFYIINLKKLFDNSKQFIKIQFNVDFKPKFNV